MKNNKVVIEKFVPLILSLEAALKYHMDANLSLNKDPDNALMSDIEAKRIRSRVSEIIYNCVNPALSDIQELIEEIEAFRSRISKIEEEESELSEEEKLVAIDVESNGLMGEFLSIAFETRHNVYYLRLSNSTIETMLDRKEIVPYVYENVLPCLNSHLTHIDEVDGEEIVRKFDPKRYFEKEFHNMYDMLEYFSHIWKHHIDRGENILMWHMGQTVDVRILEVMHRMGYIDNEYLPHNVPRNAIDISYPMQTNGYKPDSINSTCEAIAPDIYKTIKIDGSNAVLDARVKIKFVRCFPKEFNIHSLKRRIDNTKDQTKNPEFEFRRPTTEDSIKEHDELKFYKDKMNELDGAITRTYQSLMSHTHKYNMDIDFEIMERESRIRQMVFEFIIPTSKSLYTLLENIRIIEEEIDNIKKSQNNYK